MIDLPTALVPILTPNEQVSEIELDQLQSWISEEQNFWGWLQTDELRKLRQPASLLEANIGKQLNSMLHSVNSLRGIDAGARINNEHFRQLQQRVAKYIALHLQSSSVEARLIEEIRKDERYGPAVAQGAVLSLLNEPIDSLAPATLRGIILLTARLEGWSDQATSSFSAAFRELATRSTEEINEKVQELEATRKQILYNSEDLKAHGNNSIGEWQTQVADTIQEFSQKTAEAIGRINDTRTAYEERMRLSASVSYWTEAAKVHEGRYKIAWTHLKTFIAWALPAVAIAYFVLALIAIYWKSNDNLASVILGGAALAIGTGTIWAGRVLVRLFLSEKHMWTDAEERSTMVQTYLALTNEGKLTEAERQLVLSPLFRNMSDGIVRDDGTPALGIPGILSGGR